MAKAMRHARSGRRQRSRATVVDLSSVREERRRELLREHQTLQKLVDLFARLGEGRDLMLHDDAEDVFARLDAQLARTAQLTARAGDFLSGRSRD